MDYFYSLIFNIINIHIAFRVQAGPTFADLLLEHSVTRELFTVFFNTGYCQTNEDLMFQR